MMSKISRMMRQGEVEMLDRTGDMMMDKERKMNEKLAILSRDIGTKL